MTAPTRTHTALERLTLLVGEAGPALGAQITRPTPDGWRMQLPSGASVEGKDHDPTHLRALEVACAYLYGYDDMPAGSVVRDHMDAALADAPTVLMERYPTPGDVKRAVQEVAQRRLITSRGVQEFERRFHEALRRSGAWPGQELSHRPVVEAFHAALAQRLPHLKWTVRERQLLGQALIDALDSTGR